MSADPDDVSAQIDLVGVPWLVISDELSRAPNECLFARPRRAVGGHRDLPGDSHEASAAAITEGDRARQSSCRSSLPKSGDVVALGRVIPSRTSLDGS